MTQPKPPDIAQLPPARYPLVNRVMSSSPFEPDPPKPGAATPAPPRDLLMWAVTGPHPLIPKTTIVRMYVDPGVSVDVFSVSEPVAGKPQVCTCNTLPWPTVRLVESIMDTETLVEEIAAAEADGGDDPEPAPSPTPKPNGGATVPTA